MDDLYPAKTEYSALKREVADDDRQFLFNELSSLGRLSGMMWLLAPEPEQPAPPAPVIEDLLTSDEYFSAPDPTAWLKSKLDLSAEVIARTAELTVGQRDNPLWCVIRKFRIAASNFRPVLRANTHRLTKSLRARLLAAYNLETVRAITWGITNEGTVITAHTDLGSTVTSTGLWPHRSGVLGASPDGLVPKGPASVVTVHYQSDEARLLSPGIVEVKCPHADRDMSMKEAATSLKDFYLEIKNEGLFLKKTADYYHQIQGQLYMTGRHCCDLLVWTNKDMTFVRIAKDIDWAPNKSPISTHLFPNAQQ